MFEKARPIIHVTVYVGPSGEDVVTLVKIGVVRALWMTTLLTTRLEDPFDTDTIPGE